MGKFVGQQTKDAAQLGSLLLDEMDRQNSSHTGSTAGVSSVAAVRVGLYEKSMEVIKKAAATFCISCKDVYVGLHSRIQLMLDEVKPYMFVDDDLSDPKSAYSALAVKVKALRQLKASLAAFMGDIVNGPDEFELLLDVMDSMFVPRSLQQDEQNVETAASQLQTEGREHAEAALR